MRSRSAAARPLRQGLLGRRTPRVAALCLLVQLGALPANASDAPDGVARRDPLDAALDGIERSILGALTSRGSQRDEVLRNANVERAALDVAAAGADGEETALRLAGGGSVGHLGASAPRVAPDGRKTVDAADTGQAESVSGPFGSAMLGGSRVVGEVEDVSAVLASLRGGLRACYQRALQEDPGAQGGVRLALVVDAGGRVASVRASVAGDVSAALVSCIQGVARRAEFAPPAHGSAAITFPIVFVKQRAD